LFFGLDAGIEAGADVVQALDEGVFSSPGDFIAHEDADLVGLLPLVFEGEEGADFEIAGGEENSPGIEIPGLWRVPM
jgi:hypothetical protein